MSTKTAERNQATTSEALGGAAFFVFFLSLPLSVSTSPLHTLYYLSNGECDDDIECIDSKRHTQIQYRIANQILC